MKEIKDKLRACLTAGAIGDAIGFRYESNNAHDNITYNFDWMVSDDTQLTLATCEAIYNEKVNPEKIANRFLFWYNNKKILGLGASTLKALRELQVGGHWALVGRSGEFAAGNGAAMRIAPLAFKKDITRQSIKDVCSITHRNDEAYCDTDTVCSMFGQIVGALYGTSIIPKDLQIKVEKLNVYDIINNVVDRWEV